MSRNRDKIVNLLLVLLASLSLTWATTSVAEAAAESEAHSLQADPHSPSIAFLVIKNIVVIPSYDKSGGMMSQSAESSGYCSAAFVNTTGGLVTAGHCTDSHQGYKDALEAARKRIGTTTDDGFYIPPFDESQIINYYQSVTVIQTKAVQNSCIKDGRQARVLSEGSMERGDVSVLQVYGLNCPTVPLSVAANTPDKGDSVYAIGFPGDTTFQVIYNDTRQFADDDDRILNSILEPTISSGTVLDTDLDSQHTQYVSAYSMPGMSGGPVVNDRGEIIGVTSASNVAVNDPNTIVTSLDELHLKLKQQGVATDPEPGIDSLTKAIANSSSSDSATGEATQPSFNDALRVYLHTHPNTLFMLLWSATAILLWIFAFLWNTIEQSIKDWRKKRAARKQQATASQDGDATQELKVITDPLPEAPKPPQLLKPHRSVRAATWFRNYRSRANYRGHHRPQRPTRQRRLTVQLIVHR